MPRDIRGILLLSLLVMIVSGARTGLPPNASETTGSRRAVKQTATSRPTVIRVAAVQCSSELGAVEANRDKLVALVEDAAAHGAKIIVLPEASITGYLSQDLKTNWQLPGWPIERAFVGRDPTPYAETVPGPSTKRFAELAKRLRVYITVPLVEIDRTPTTQPSQKSASDKKTADSSGEKERKRREDPPAARFFNTVVLVSPDGEIVAHYRKLTPWPYPEKSWATAGDRGVQVYDTEYGRVGLAICFDIHTILEKYEPEHIWALLYPIAWVDTTHPAEWFWHKLPERLKPFKHYVIGANWSVDEKQAWYGYGFSTIFGPDGNVLSSATSLFGSEIIYADIETAPIPTP